MAEYYPMTPPSISAGAKVYAANCAMCHGPNGDGKGSAATGLTPPATDFTDPEHAYGDPPQDWYVSILQGHPGTAMAAYEDKLSESDIWNVLLYARQFITTPQKVAAGKALYAQSCAACHGDKGDGNGPLATALKPPAANFTDAQMMAAHSSQELFDTLTNGKGAMPAFTSSLTEEQRWDVVNYLWAFVYVP